MVFQNDILAGSSGGSSASSVYQIDQSIRFNSADTAYMHRTPSSTGNRKTFTSSFWVKLGKLGVNTQLPMPSVTHGIGSSGISLTTANVLNAYMYYGGSWSGLLIGTRVFRDPSAWLNFVIVVDTTDSTASERIRIYINGQRETSFSTANYPSQNTDTDWNLSGEKMWIGIDPSGSSYNGEYYASEIVYIDGQALDPSNFGEENENGIWIPKDVSSLSFGTNGFHLKGESASDLGNDSSSNNNDFTTSGLASHDQMVGESPTNNFAVTNAVNSHSNITLSEGNLKEVNSGTSIAYGSSSTILLTSGKWYVEWRLNTLVSNEYPVVGLYSTNKGRGAMSTSYNFPGLNYPGSGYNDIGFGANNGNRFEDNTTSSWGNSYASGNIGALAIDMDNKKIWFGHNNSGSFVWQASGNPSTGSNEANTKAFASDVVVGVGHYSSSSVTFNYGQDGTFGGTETAQGNSDANGVGNFYYAPPSGFLAICTKNLGS